MAWALMEERLASTAAKKASAASGLTAERNGLNEARQLFERGIRLVFVFATLLSKHTPHTHPCTPPSWPDLAQTRRTCRICTAGLPIQHWPWPHPHLRDPSGLLASLTHLAHKQSAQDLTQRMARCTTRMGRLRLVTTTLKLPER